MKKTLIRIISIIVFMALAVLARQLCSKSDLSLEEFSRAQVAETENSDLFMSGEGSKTIPETEEDLVKTVEEIPSYPSPSSGNSLTNLEQLFKRWDDDFELFQRTATYTVGRKNLLSPVFSLEENIPEGIEKIELIWEYKSNSYFLQELDPNKEKFVINFRLDLGNIDNGENKYTFRFHLKGEEMKEYSFFLITNFSEIRLGDYIVYVTNYYDSFTRSYINSDESRRGNFSDILIQHNGEYIAYNGILFYDKGTEQLFEITDLKMDQQQDILPYRKIKLFQGPVIWESSESIQYCAPGDSHLFPYFSFSPEQQKIEIEKGQGCTY